MTPLLLEDISFWEVVWWMIMVFFFTMAIWIFIAVVADIFRRNDIGGFAKAIWLLFIFIMPFLGALLYMLFRPAMTEQDRQIMNEYQARSERAAGYSASDEIAKAQTLLASGAISQEEFDNLKRKALS